MSDFYEAIGVSTGDAERNAQLARIADALEAIAGQGRQRPHHTGSYYAPVLQPSHEAAHGAAPFDCGSV